MKIPSEFRPLITAVAMLPALAGCGGRQEELIEKPTTAETRRLESGGSLQPVPPFNVVDEGGGSFVARADADSNSLTPLDTKPISKEALAQLLKDVEKYGPEKDNLKGSGSDGVTAVTPAKPDLKEPKRLPFNVIFDAKPIPKPTKDPK